MIRPVIGDGRRRLAAQLAVGGIGAVIWIQFALSVIRPAVAAGRYPTSTYWVAPRLVWEGRADELYDAAAFGRAALELGANFDLGLIPAAPPHVLMLLPFGLLPQSTAFALWTALGLAALVAAVALLVRRLSVPPLAAAAVLAALPLFQPVRHNFGFGQAFTFLLLALTVAALLGRRNTRDAIRAGVGLAAAFIVKFWYGAAATAAVLFGGRPRAAAVAVALIALAALASLPIVGADGWLTWFETSLAWRERPETAVTAYQTLHSLFSHLFRYDARWNPAPVAHLPLLADLLWWLALVALALITLLCLRRLARSRIDPLVLNPAALALALTVPAAILVSPIAEDYHYVQTLLSFIVGGWIISRSARHAPATGLLIAALVLIGLPWPFNQPAVAGWWTLLFYPRVYGALALWLSLVLLARSTQTDRGQ